MVALLLLLWLAPSAKADEGMWLLPYLAKLNIKDMKAKGLKLSAEDIYSINRMALKDAIVIFGGGCTGEVVSERGLVLTNHHCGYGAIQQQSTVEHDYLKHGFWAMSDQEEIPSPGLTVTFIRKIEDVSQEVLAEVTAQMSEAQRTEAITAAMGRVQQKVLPLPAGQQV
ncbi:MAG: S46 family peptidase, partial [Alistipes sp.]|nr:S46 family peptidase [Alistipes sp.]